MTEKTIKLIVGLANPGQQYVNTRHNAGAWLVDALLKPTHLKLKIEHKFQGLMTKMVFDKETCWVFIPTTYMNNSGSALRAITHFYRMEPDAILVVHDDLDISPGYARFKQGGGEGGHNGLKDITAKLGSKNFWRLRLGIGHPGDRYQVHHYVLTSPPAAEKQKIQAAISRVLTVLPDFINGKKEKAIQTLHTTQE